MFSTTKNAFASREKICNEMIGSDHNLCQYLFNRTWHQLVQTAISHAAASKKRGAADSANASKVQQ
jgi:hypothetical protein